MTPEFVVEILRQALMMTLWLGAPLLIIGFLAGIVVSLIQIVTSIQDTGFSTIPRLVGFLLSTVLLMPWMLKQLVSYTVGVFTAIAKYGH